MADPKLPMMMAAQYSDLPIPGTFVPVPPRPKTLDEALRGISQEISQKAIGGASSVAEALMAPGNALQGQYNQVEINPDGSVNPVNSALIAQALNMAGTIGGGGSVVPRPVNSLGMFGGVRARTANMENLAIAQSMDAKGIPNDAIIRATGWFKGPDGQWRFEIPDNKASVNTTVAAQGDAPQRQVPLPNILSHAALYEAYPDLANINVAARMTAGEQGGQYTLPRTVGNRLVEGIAAEAPTPTDLKSVLLHEAQHAIQQREGFASGSSPELYQQQAEANLALQALSWRREIAAKKQSNPNLSDRQIEKLVAEDYANMGAADWIPPPEARQIALDYDTNPNQQLQEVVDLYFPRGKVSPDSPMQMYRRSAGEVEARNVQGRMDMTARERKQRAPWETQDTPFDAQIARMLFGE